MGGGERSSFGFGVGRDLGCDLSYAAIGVEARGRVPRIGDDDDFVSRCCGDEALEAGLHGGIRSDDGGTELALDGDALPLRPEWSHGIDGRPQLNGLVADEAEKALLRRGEKFLRGGVGLRSNDLDADHEPWLLQNSAGLEVLAIDAGRGLKHVGGEVSRKGKRETEGSGEARAVVARSKKRDGNAGVAAGDGFDDLAGLIGTEVGAEFLE